MLFYISIVYSFLFLSTTPLFGYITICLSFHLLMMIWIISTLELYEWSCSKHLYASLSQRPRRGLATSQGRCTRAVQKKYPVVNASIVYIIWLDPFEMTLIYLSFEETAELFLNVIVAFFINTSNAREFRFRHILTNT